MTLRRAETLTEAAAFLITAVAMAAAAQYAVGAVSPPVPPAENSATIALILAAPPPAPSVPPAPAAPPAPAPIKPRLVQLPSPLPPPRPLQRHSLPAATPTRAALPAPYPAPRKVDAPPASQPTARAGENLSEDALYTAAVHAVIERHKSNPRTPAYRMLHPHGTVTIAFTLDRGGTPGEAHVSAGSGAGMLDQQAMLIVANCRFPPMPPHAFSDSATHDFQVEITFPPFGGAGDN